MSLNTINNKLIKRIILSIIWILSGTVMANQQPSYQLIEGVIVDNKGENIYTIHPKKGLDSVSLKTGLVNWHSEKATLPILINNKNLIAQVEYSGETLSLMSLNTVNGEQIYSKQFSLPSNTSAPISDGLDIRFKIMTSFDNKANGEIYWEYNYKKAQGMLLENTPKPIKHYGKFIQNKSHSLDAMKMQLIDKPIKSTTKSIVGKFFNNVNDPNSRQFKSLDGQHILVSKIKEDPSKWNKYAWNIFDKSGNLIGSTSHTSSYTPFFVSDKVIVYVNQPNARLINNNWIKSPLTLQAVSLESGQPLWNKEVRDLKFKGPYPH